MATEGITTQKRYFKGDAPITAPATPPAALVSGQPHESLRPCCLPCIDLAKHVPHGSCGLCRWLVVDPRRRATDAQLATGGPCDAAHIRWEDYSRGIQVSSGRSCAANDALQYMTLSTEP